MTIIKSEKLGTGFPLIMLHGWGRDYSDFKPMGELLSTHSEVHLIDLPGFGKSEAPPHAWSSVQYAERLISYLDEQGIEQVDLIGHSFGGKVAMSFASQFPDRVRNLVLMASSGLKKKRSLSEKLHFLSIRALGKTIKCIDRFMGTSLFHEKFSPRFGSTDYKNVQGVMREIFVKSVNEDISPFLKSIKAPTLILWGANDTETPPEMAVRLNSSISHSKMFLFPYKGHYLHEDSGSHLCTSYVEAFLKEGKKHVSF